MHHRLSISLIIGAGLSLNACGNKSEDDIPVPVARSDNKRVEDQFGKGFGKAFRADPMSEPASVSDNDVVPVSRTAEPVEIN